jgi:putative Mg2+ transporter-C (MgtC) family protein
MFIAAAVAEALSLVTLILLGMLEKRIFPTERFKLLEISYKNNSPNTTETLGIIKTAGIQIQSIDVNQGSKDKGTRLRLLVRIPNTADIASLAREIKSSGNVGKVEIKEKY